MDSESQDRIEIYELVLDRCALTNAVSDTLIGRTACNATSLCYETISTCKDPCNYTCGKHSLYFSCGQVPLSLGIETIANVIGPPQTKPVIAELGDVFSTRGQISIEFADDKHNDYGVDPYLVQRRGGIPNKNAVPGTFWRRFKARNKYPAGRLLRHYQGPSDGVFPDDFLCTEYIIDTVEPNGNCITITALDILLLAGDQVQCPAPRLFDTTSGLETELSLQFSLAEGAGSNIGANLLKNADLLWSDDAETDYVCIGSEFVRVITTAATNGNGQLELVYSVVERGACGTEATRHDIGTAMSIPLIIPKETHVVDAIETLLTQCARLEEIVAGCCGDDEPPERLCRDDLDGIKECNPFALIGRDVFLCEQNGESVQALLNEISQQFLIDIFVDQRTNKIRFIEYRPRACNLTTVIFSRCDLAADVTPTIEPVPEERVSALFFRMGAPKNETPTGSNVTDTFLSVSVDALREPCDRHEYAQVEVDQIFSRWFDKKCTGYLAQVNAERIRFLRACEPEVMTLQISNAAYERAVQTQGDWWIGSYFTLHDDEVITDADGEFSNAEWRVRSIEHDSGFGCWQITASSTPFLTTESWVQSLDCHGDGCEAFIGDGAQLDDCAIECTAKLW
jgi:hypothetical protein